MEKQYITLFQLNLQKIYYTELYKKILKTYPKTFILWEDFKAVVYLQGEQFQPTQIYITPQEIKIFKENRKFDTDFIYHWLGENITEYNGERFCESIYEYRLLLRFGEWFKDEIQFLIEQQKQFNVLLEKDFIEQTNVSKDDYKLIHQSLKKLQQDIQNLYGYQVDLHLEEYYSYYFWKTKNVASLMVVNDSHQYIQFKFYVGMFHVSIHTNDDAFLNQHHLLIKICRNIAKEIIYSQISQQLLRKEVRKRKEVE